MTTRISWPSRRSARRSKSWRISPAIASGGDDARSVWAVDATPLESAAAETTVSEETAAAGGDAVAEAPKYDIFNTDRRLRGDPAAGGDAGADSAEEVDRLLQRRHDRAASDNKVELRAAIDARRAGERSIYPVDTRGFRRSCPAATHRGERTRESARSRVGASRADRCSLFASQETLHDARVGYRRRKRSSTPTSSARRSRGATGHLSRTTCSDTAARTPTQDGRFRKIAVR